MSIDPVKSRQPGTGPWTGKVISVPSYCFSCFASSSSSRIFDRSEAGADDENAGASSEAETGLSTVARSLAS